ncbi:hypothetical protein [uncultured Oscillibacter sp.]|uniref:hypothetical protein n=1 Tax=uncultured Oscillibacter sp. TaxID=876091 RepID=UPI0025DF1078|nr:hypothetical protein [uncultured Oscillibacter sp.]
MSGELILEKSDWRRVLAAVVGVCVLDGALMIFFLPRLHMTGMTLAVVAALTAYVLFRLLYPALEGMLPGGKETVKWNLTADTLHLGGTAIDRSTIKMVHCWPNRDALGNRGNGITVNIETTGKNQLLRSVRDGVDADPSARQLRALVTALGYGSRWPAEQER